MKTTPIFLVMVTDFMLDGSVKVFPSCAYEKNEDASFEGRRIQQMENPKDIEKRIVTIMKIDYLS